MGDLLGSILHGRGLVSVKGAAARDFLQGLITQDMAALTPRRAQYAALLSPQGKILFDFFLAERASGEILIDVDAERAGDLVKRLGFYRLRSKVEIAERSETLAVAAIWGEGAALASGLEEAPGAAMGEGEVLRLVDPRDGALGVRLIGPPAALEDALQGVAPAAAQDHAAHAFAMGAPDLAQTIAPETVFALEAGLDRLNGVSFKKGCYVGQELTARMGLRDAVRKRLTTVRLVGPTPETPQEIRAGARAVGELRLAMGTRGFALLKLDRWAAARAAGETAHAGETRVEDWRP